MRLVSILQALWKYSKTSLKVLDFLAEGELENKVVSINYSWEMGESKLNILSPFSLQFWKITFNT